LVLTITPPIPQALYCWKLVILLQICLLVSATQEYSSTKLEAKHGCYPCPSIMHDITSVDV